MPDTNPLFPMNVTPDEKSAGFTLSTVKNPSAYGLNPDPDVHAVTRTCANGWLAVKTMMPDRDIRYAIWHDRDGKVAADVEFTPDGVVKKYG